MTIIGLGFTVRAARTAADLASVQSEFVSAVSHDENPLSLIKLASDTLAKSRYESPAAIADYGHLMTVEAQHLTRLIDNVLCYARISDRASDYDFETVDIADPIHESIDRFRPQLNEAAFDVQIHLPVDPPLVRGDHVMLAHVFDNLVDNALKYAASGRTLGITVARGGRSIRIEVADRGDGIPAEDLPRVFDKFYRRKGTRQSGAGLGLAIVRQIVHDHGGVVRITSTPGEGTSVQVMLPVTEG